MLDLDTCHLGDVLDAVANGSITATAVVEQLLARIHLHNPDIRALTDVLADRARTEARHVDEHVHIAPAAGNLRGAPIAIKDIIDTTPARCCAGLDLLRDYIPEQDAELIARLRQAGAVLVGVAATDTGAFGVRTPSVQHPQAPDYDVGGSSGGSAAAVAAGFALGSIGTDTGGSIRIPAACCSLAGFKPTHGRVSLVGIRPLAPSLDHAGPLARRVTDLIKLQAVLDPQLDLRAARLPERPLVLGYDPDYYADAQSMIQEAFSALLTRLQARGHTVTPIALPHPDAALESQWVIGGSESAAYYLGAFSQVRTDLPDMIRDALAMAEQQRGHEYVQVSWNVAQRRARVDQALQQVDAVLAPTLPLRAPLRSAESVKLGGIDQPMLNALMRYTCLFNETGHPVVSLPITPRDDEGLSVSAQVVGRRQDDARILAIAAHIESLCGLAFRYALPAC